MDKEIEKEIEIEKEEFEDDFPQKTSNKRSLMVFFLFTLSLIVIIAGFTLIKNQIKSPFSKKVGWELFKKQEEIKRVALLKTKDTDKDKLSDFDELYIYHTSPYLEDTDSDGYSDKEEVDSHHDPLCPEGEDCGYLGAAGTFLPSAESNNLTSLENSPLSTLFSSNENQLNNFSNLPLNLSSQEIREFLEKSGFPKETLDKLDDQTLKQAYQETLEELKKNNSLNSLNNTNSSLNNLSGNDFKSVIEKMSPEQIRELLIASGMDENFLKEFDDNTLKQMLLETLAQ